MMLDEGDNQRYSTRTLCCTCIVQLILLVMVILVLAYGVRYPVRVTVKDATVRRFGLAGTALAYDLSLTVSVHNPNWAMRAEHAAPLDVDICFAGFDGARLAAAGSSVKPEESDEIRLAAVGERTAAALLGSDGVAELVKETTAGQLESLELKLSGELTYRPVHVGRYKLAVTCPLRLPVAPAGTSGVVVLDKVIKCH
ncbi:LOW QUALITY PROTEIN: hypothetical protein BDA96_01G019800 [Sorghum bicolor]|uniref:Late embryogenesis abundant protein LEA-2 subgroup domain-containing protein n=1 Tax=Sorghum bicolor TaxID=4558 RepID=A0A921RW41_SORBI|nr:LOW QUALITY PROTEIN: hypothetical protein BDA96_01G019800 [Sorghum bicolor]